VNGYSAAMILHIFWIGGHNYHREITAVAGRWQGGGNDEYNKLVVTADCSCISI
jgi:hypothetical protein